MMDLQSHIREIQEGLRAGRFINEASVRQGIVLRLLTALGWPTYDPQVVWPEFSVEGRRVDIALCHPQAKPLVFIEIKPVGSSEGADRQLFEYAFHKGVPMAVLTTGQEWHFYLPAEQGEYQERRVYKLDILERDVEDSASRVNLYLSYDAVRSGAALKAAREDYRNIARTREIERTVPEAWRDLLTEPDSLLVDLLSDKVESLCGFKPEPDSLVDFLAHQVNVSSSVSESPLPELVAPSQPAEVMVPSPAHTSGEVGFMLEGRWFAAKNARGVLIEVLEQLSSKDSTFLQRYAARKHGRRRRYIAQTPNELYPGRMDLANEFSHQLKSGWWVGLNYSKKQIGQMLQIAAEVAGLRYGRELIVRLG